MENLIYIVLGIIFFIVQVYRESQKLKKRSKKLESEPILPKSDNDEVRNDDMWRGRRIVNAEKKEKMEDTIREQKGHEAFGFRNPQRNPEQVEKNKSDGISKREKTELNNERYAEMFKNAQAARKAFIASEIFTRKHF